MIKLVRRIWEILWGRQSWRTLAWFVVTLVVILVAAGLPVETIEQVKAYYLTGPALLAFAFGLAGSYLGSVIDDCKTLRCKPVPWLQFAVGVVLTGGVYLLHFRLLDILGDVSEEDLQAHGLSNLELTGASWAIFIGAWLLPVGFAFVSSRPRMITKPTVASTNTDPAVPPSTCLTTPGRKFGRKASPRTAVIAGFWGMVVGYTLGRRGKRRYARDG